MEDSLTLKQVQLRLGVAQHVLIHLCEKGVVEPDVDDTLGRGNWRRFSQRNLFEFAIALELRKYQIPVSITGAVIKVLRSFERSVREKQHLEFSFPVSFPDVLGGVNLYLYGGEYIVFSMGKGVKFGFNVTKLLDGNLKQVRVEKLTKLPTDYQSYLSLDLTALAQSISSP